MADTLKTPKINESNILGAAVLSNWPNWKSPESSIPVVVGNSGPVWRTVLETLVLLRVYSHIRCTHSSTINCSNSAVQDIN